MSQRVFVRNLGGTPIVLDVAESSDGVTDGDKGDITVSGGGTVWTIDSDVIREKLTANRTYYVRDGGSDSNTGLVNDDANAFLTIQHAVNVAASLDQSIYSTLIQIEDTTFNEDVILKSYVGTGPITIQGNSSAVPASGNYRVNAASICFRASSVRGVWVIAGIDCVTSGGQAIQVDTNSVVGVRNLRFGTGNAIGLYAVDAALITNLNFLTGSFEGDFTTASNHGLVLYSSAQSLISITSSTFTQTGTPAWSDAFAGCDAGAGIWLVGNTYTGAATGKRYRVSMNGWISTFGSTLPGNVAGTTATGGQYA